MCSGLYCVVLCRETKCIKSDREKYIIAFHTTFSGNNLQTGICFDMSYVHTGTAWIWELYQTIEFRFVTVIFGFEDFGLFPFCLPLRLDLFKQVFHLYTSSNILLYLKIHFNSMAPVCQCNVSLYRVFLL